jgi:drug/metabolite transporter (DMT)-like permease
VRETVALLAFGLVLVSAVTHALWNLLAKQAQGGTAFVWLFSTLATLIYLPLVVAILLIQQPIIGLTQLGAMAGTCVLHVAYYFLLTRSYQAGDLSLVYPVSRGVGPLLSVFGAVLLLGERPSPLVLLGAGLVTLGVMILTGSPASLRRSGSGPALTYGLLLAVVIAAYTLWDKSAVSAALVPPLVLTWASNAARMVFLAPYAYRHRDDVLAAWKHNRREAVGIGILDSFSYILFLLALTFSSVSYLAPVRQSSILIGAFLGSRLLQEKAGNRRLAAALVMVIGVVSLALLGT